MKKKFLAVVLCLCTVLMTACSSAGTISTYTISLDEMPKNFDPQVASSDSELLVLTNIYDGLFEYRNGTVQPNVCERYDLSADGLTYTFYLKNDSSFYLSKNEQIPVTAQDFDFALSRVLDKSTRSPYYSSFSHIENILVIDDYTLQVTLSKADNEFIAKLCLPAAFPCNRDFFAKTNGAYGLRVNDILSNGPFTINYLADDGSYATLVRVVEKNGGIDRIRVSLSDKETPVSQLYADDKISGFFAYNSDISSLDGTVYSYENSTFNMFFNTENEVLQNTDIRRAFSYYCYAMENSGANLEAVNQQYSIFTGAMTMGDSRIDDVILPTRPSYMEKDAKKLLQDGLGELGKMSIGSLTVLIPSDVAYSVIAENINQLWQKNLNAFLAVEFLPSAEIEKRLARGDFDIAFYSYTPTENNILNVIEPFANYSSDMENCVNNIKSSSGSSAAAQYVSQAQNIILEKALIVPMCSDSANYIHKDYFTGVEVNPFGNIVNLKYAAVR
ncbi:MAG: hypothetical protein E7488_03500 [Ruminococcaceae bacterium]|nr:hypothetical protein [Oscillospiraceae bacterium]